MKESNKNALRSNLMTMERVLQDIAFYLGNLGFTGLLSSTKVDIEPEKLREVSSMLAAVMGEITEIKKRYKLREEAFSARDSIRTSLIDLDILLDELSPKRLQAYGELDSADEKYIVAKIDKLKAMLEEIDAAIR